MSSERVDPILKLATPQGISSKGQGDFVDAIKDLNSARLQQIEILKSLRALPLMKWHIACSPCRADGPESETQDTLDMYGIKDIESHPVETAYRQTTC